MVYGIFQRTHIQFDGLANPGNGNRRALKSNLPDNRHYIVKGKIAAIVILRGGTNVNFNTKMKTKAVVIPLLVGMLSTGLFVLAGKASTPKQIQYLTLSRDVAMGSVLNEANVTPVTIRGDVPKGAFTDIKAVKDQVLIVPGVSGEPIIQGMLAKTPIKEGLTDKQVGVWVPTDLASVGLVKPGDIVDVYGGPKKVAEKVTVINMVDAGGKEIKTGVPAAVELAIDPGQQEVFAGAGIKFKLFPNPWGVTKP